MVDTTARPTRANGTAGAIGGGESPRGGSSWDQRPASGRTQARARVDDLRLSLSLLAVMAALTVALGGLITGAAWWLELLLASVVVLGVSAGCRATRLPRSLAPILSMAALVLLVTGLFAPQTALFGFLPTPATVAEFVRLSAKAQLSFYNQGVPADPLPEFLFLMVVSGGVIAWTSDLVAIVLRRPALVGVVVIAALLAPAALLDGGISPFALVLCLIAYLLLLRADVRRTRRSGAELGTSIAIAAGAIVVALVIGTTAPGFQQVGRQAIPSAGVVFGQGVSALIDLGADLRRPVPVTVIDYSTTASTPAYLRMTTLDTFSGEIWRHTRSKSTFFSSETSIDDVPGLSKHVKTAKATTTVQVHNLTSQWLPAPYPVQKVSGLNGSWGWEQNDLTISGYTSTTDEQNYTVTTKTVQPTPQQLRDAGENYPASVDADLLVPSGSPAIIRSTALAVTADALTPYDKAVALQAYFHDGEFRYSLNAPKDGGYDDDTPGTVATFLKQKAGYCVHFAAAMTLMARDLGIPARIAVGYLPGNETGTTGKASDYEVSSDDLHAWPELYFPGVGWTPFEPTVGRGTVPSYSTAQGATPQPTDTPTGPSTTAPQKRFATDAPGTTVSSAQATTEAISSSTSVAAVVLIILGVLITPALLRRNLRRRRLTDVRDGAGNASDAWAELRASALDLGLAAPSTETPRAFADRLRRTWEDAPQANPDAVQRQDATAALAELLSALEEERFGSPDTVWADPVLADDVATVVGAIAATAGLAQRMRATLVPISLFEGRLRSPATSRSDG
ncbi:transglutaminase domain-containing protein [Planctomonas sp. JC2975]|uniref:transglutaminaseTgpA domain-containing protein n=1 Tax=Planctomonas sp. JC2975 TaxID=2729626 RepID=UPI001473DFF8|nr:transglutaminase domain-containing protein [Planctomonas sp. JC2975]